MPRAKTAVSDSSDPGLRHLILAAAESEFAAVGLYDARVEEIARAAGIAKGTVYLYFSSKEELIRSVAKVAFDDLGARCRAAVERRSTRQERIRALVGAHARFFAERPERLRILHQVRGMLKFSRPEWRGLRRALDDHLLALSVAIDARKGDPDRFANAARLLFGSVSGTASVWAAAGSQVQSKSGRALPSQVVSALATAVELLADRSRDSSETVEQGPRLRALSEVRR